MVKSARHKRGLLFFQYFPPYDVYRPFLFLFNKNHLSICCKGTFFLEDVSEISANSLRKARMVFCFYLDFNIGFVRIKKPFSNDIPNWQPEPVKIPSINTPALRHYLMDKKAFVVGMGINCSILGICLSCRKKIIWPVFPEDCTLRYLPVRPHVGKTLPSIRKSVRSIEFHREPIEKNIRMFPVQQIFHAIF